MDHFPIFLKLAGRDVLVVGGGEIAARKAALLLRARARVHVVAPELGDGLALRRDAGEISWHDRRFTDDDLGGMALVIAATGDRMVNAAVAAAAEARHLPVNVVDAPALCSFIVPAIVERGRIVAAISSGGASPVLARLVKARLELALPDGIALLAELAAAWRKRVKAALPDPAARRRFWESCLDLAWRGGPLPDPERLLAEAGRPPGRIETVEVPLDDPETIPMRWVRRICTADLVLHDPAMPTTLLDFARRDAELRPIRGPVAEALRAAEADVRSGRTVVALVAAPRP